MRQLFTIFQIFVCAISMAQNFSFFPEDIIVRNTMSTTLVDYLENPQNQTLKASAYLKQRTGLFKEIRSSQVNSQFSFDDSNIGIDVTSARKGEFIQLNRLYLNYAKHVKIDRHKYLAGGVSMGLVSYAIKSNTGGPSATDMQLDASIGVAYYDRRNTINLTFNQLPQPTVDPLYEEIILPRFVQALALRNYNSGELWSGHYYARVDVYANSYSQFSIGHKLLYDNRVSLGLSINTDGDYFACLGAHIDSPKTSRLDVYMGYQEQSGITGNRYRVASFQLGIIFFYKK